MTITTHRRDLLKGLACLAVAPAIVRASSLMPVKNFYYDRVICDYLIGTDQIAIRMDRATFPLVAPKGLKLLTISDVKDRIPLDAIRRFQSFRPAQDQQQHLTFIVPHISSDHGKLI